MKIVQFTAENVKKLKLVNITPKGDFVQITGKNGSGKTSVLDSIWWALAGKDAMKGQAKPIRDGEEKARIRLDLGDIIVERRFLKSGTTSIFVESADGARYPSPQTILDGIIGHLSFDPLEFSRMAPKDQFDTLRRVADVKIDFEKLAMQDRGDVEKRRDINRDVDTLKGQLAGIKLPDTIPTEGVDTAALAKELDEIHTHNATVQAGLDVQARYNAECHAIQEQIEQLEKELLKAKVRLQNGQNALAELKIEAPRDPTEVQAKLANAQNINDAFNSAKRHGELKNEIKAKEAESLAFTKSLEARQTLREDTLKETPMPVEGLQLGEGEVMLKGIPFNQLSSAEQLRVSVAIAMSANPKLRIIRIKDGSLLDETGLKLIQDAAAEKDYQVWCERVDSSGKVGILMEDGMVAKVDGEQVAA